MYDKGQLVVVKFRQQQEDAQADADAKAKQAASDKDALNFAEQASNVNLLKSRAAEKAAQAAKATPAVDPNAKDGRPDPANGANAGKTRRWQTSHPATGANAGKTRSLGPCPPGQTSLVACRGSAATNPGTAGKTAEGKTANQPDQQNTQQPAQQKQTNNNGGGQSGR